MATCTATQCLPLCSRTAMPRLIVLLGLAATLVLASVPASQAAEKSIWGPSSFSVGDVNCPTGPDPCSAFPMYKQLGADTYQFQIPWDTVSLLSLIHISEPTRLLSI